MKTQAVFFTLICLIACNRELSHNYINDNVADFEKKYCSSLAEDGNSGNDEFLYIVGFSTIKYEQSEMKKIREIMDSNSSSLGNVLIDNESLRFYYPLPNAVISIKGKVYVADETGRIKYKGRIEHMPVKLIARETSESSRYSSVSNCVTVSSSYNNIPAVVFDFGSFKFY